MTQKPSFWDIGSVVEDMIEKGRSIVQSAVEEHKPIAVFGGFSGGDDSIVACHFAVATFGAAIVHCNTLTGAKACRDFVVQTADRLRWHLIEKTAGPSGPPRTTMIGEGSNRKEVPFDPSRLPGGKWTDGSTAYEEFCFNFGMPGPGMHGRMYDRLKGRSFSAVVRETKKGHKYRDKVMLITGIRSDESVARAGYNRAVQQMGGIIWVNPFYFSGAVEFDMYREEFGLPRSPVKKIVGISGDCFCGTLASPGELELIGRVDPARQAYLIGLEDKCRSLGLPCQWGTPPDKRGEEDSPTPACVGCFRKRG